MTQVEVLNRGYAKEIYEYAYNNPTADMGALTQALLKAKRLPDRYSNTANGVKDFDFEDFEYYDNPYFEDYELDYYYYIFARDIKGANVSLLEASLNEDDEEIIYKFARDVRGTNIELLQSKMRFAFPKYIYLFARDVENVNVQVLEDYLLDWLPETYDMNFAKDLVKYTLLFAQDIEGTNIYKMISNIQLFISNYLVNPKQSLPNYCIDILEELIKELEVIQNNKKNSVLTKIKKDMSL